MNMRIARCLIPVLLILLMLPVAVGSQEKKIILTYWAWGASVDVINDVVGPAFSEIHPNVEVVAVSMGPWDLHDKLYAGLVTGQDLPDIAQLVRRQFHRYAVPELMVDFTAFLDEHAGDFAQSAVDDITFDGIRVGVPLDYDPGYILYHRELAADLGIDTAAIDTWDDFVKIAKEVSASHPNIYVNYIAYPAGAWGANYWKLYAQPAGALLYSEDGKLIRDNKQAAAVFTFFDQLTRELNTLRGSVNDPALLDMLRKKELLFLPSSTMQGGWFRQQLPEMAGKLGAIAWPRWDSDAPAYVASWGGVVLVAPKKGPNADLAAEFIKFFSTNNMALQENWLINGGYPAYLPAAAELGEAVAREGEFIAGLLAATEARELGPWNYFSWSETEEVMGDALDSMAAGRMTPTEAWTWAERELVRRTQR